MRKTSGIVAICFLLAAGTGIYLFRHLGWWLELDEPLRPSTAIVVLGGGVPFRAMEAAEIYNAKWANQIWITQGAIDSRDRALARIGLAPAREYEANEMVLTKLGVPLESIHVIPDRVDNTVEEEKAILHYASLDHSGKAPSLILVTSKYHARRVRVIWDLVSGGRAAAIVRFTAEESYDAAHWWNNSGDALATFKELFGILNARAGFPVQPREHE
jgi:uncharacterized SAM-binding protein YcdF (DUF218 family)